ncbi:MAG TPA: hypothetical protein VNZ45_07625 [Bacteroidia bacterium]|jgi:hypothetical protein|nr:hypothetical protein [Bacteroidia bacterium]
MSVEQVNKVSNQNTVKLLKVVDDVTKVVAALKHSTDEHDDLVNKIAVKEQELGALEVRFQEEERRRQVELELSFKERELTKAAEVIAKQGKIAVPQTEFTTLQTEFNTLKSDFSKKLEDEVNKVKAQEAARTGAAIKQKELELQVKEAGNNASINALTEKLTLLSTQVTDYKQQLHEERDARVKESQARGTPMVTVNSGK